MFQKQILACQLAAKALAKAAQVKGGQPNAADYDSDEDTEGGTWEHKKRLQEMEKTKGIKEKLFFFVCKIVLKEKVLLQFSFFL